MRKKALASVGHLPFVRWMAVSDVTDTDVCRHRHWCLSRQTLMPVTSGIDVHRHSCRIRQTGCPHRAFPAFFRAGWFVRISLSCWECGRWAFSVPFFPAGSTSGRKQAILRRRKIQIVRKHGRHGQKGRAMFRRVVASCASPVLRIGRWHRSTPRSAVWIRAWQGRKSP